MRRTSPSNVFTNIKRIFFIAAILYNSAIPFTAAAQGWKWATGSSCINGLAETGPIAVDKSGNVYEIGFIGYFPGETSTITSVFGPFTVVDTGHLNGQGILVSTDSNGAYRWVIASNGYADFANVVTDPYGNIYILGVFNYYPSFTFGGRSFTGSGNFVIKVASTGNVLWIKNIGSNFAMGSKISISRAGNIYIGGVFNAPVTIGATTLTNTDISGTTSDVFYAAYDSSMNPLWVKSFGGTGNDYLSDMVVANDSDVYIAGYFRSAG